ncbi:MAG TPA: ABC transporter substrate-binding protein [Candidatus Deferrimicrobium sp.]|nr:ABC transporter substrate-binding protein [Candidatus Deferrimicrobium sp.]
MKKCARRIGSSVIVSLACLLALTPRAAPHDIVIFLSDSLTATVRTMSGAQKVVEREHPDAGFHTFRVDQFVNSRQTLIDSVKGIQPELLLTIGTAATRLARNNFPGIPTVFAAVMYPELSGFVTSTHQPGGNMTGASIDVPVDVQFRYFKKIVPRLSRIGVLYTDSTASLIPPAAAEARRLNLTLVPLKVSDPKDLPTALDSLAAVTEGIWSLPDPILFDPRSTKFILLHTIRKGIPFMGFSRNVVESGALFALDFDYKAVGQQAGKIVTRILSGESPQNIAVSSADVIWFHYNEKTAKHIAITIPDELAAVAKEVYR